MTSSNDSDRLTQAEIEEFREDNRRSGALVRELIRAENDGSRKQAPQAAEAISETMRQLEEATAARI